VVRLLLVVRAARAKLVQDPETDYARDCTANSTVQFASSPGDEVFSAVHAHAGCWGFFGELLWVTKRERSVSPVRVWLDVPRYHFRSLQERRRSRRELVAELIFRPSDSSWENQSLYCYTII
jgi:hypothetical protein